MSAQNAIKQRAIELGFLACGFVKARFLGEEAEHLQQWLQKGFHGEMAYMERNQEKRLDPQKLVEGTKTILCVAYNYFPQKLQKSEVPKIAKYAYGEDYHRVVKDKCHELISYIKEWFPEVSYRIFVDSAPVMERQWAQLAGLGWIGKHSLLIRKGVGSFFFLGEIFLDIAFDEEISQTIPTNHCGSCTKCIDACPTQAIVADQVVDATKCLSYLSIEKRNPLNETELNMMNSWLFGCDICQDVCPWNRFSQPHQEPRFEPFEGIDWNIEDWKNTQESTFKEQFKHSPISRMGLSKIKQLVDHQRKH